MAAWRGKAKAREIKRREKLEAKEARRAERKVKRVDLYREATEDPTVPGEPR
jgi:hypothetical protein